MLNERKLARILNGRPSGKLWILIVTSGARNRSTLMGDLFIEQGFLPWHIRIVNRCKRSLQNIRQVVGLYLFTYLCIKESMPVISMFYGIIIRMFFFDNKEHKMPHITLNMLSIKQLLKSLLEGCWPGIFLRINWNWSLHGLKFIKMNWWQTGSWR